MSHSSLVDASFLEIDHAIRRALVNGVLPQISPTTAPFGLAGGTDSDAIGSCYNLLLLYNERFASSHTRNLNEYGFSTWESPHPYLNDMNKIFNVYHWYHMNPIVKKVEREVRIAEIERGVPYTATERVELIVAKAIVIRQGEYEQTLKETAFHSRRRGEERISKMYADTKATFTSLDNKKRAAKQQASVGERVSSFYSNNPFWSGVIGALLYHKAKDTFGNK